MFGQGGAIGTNNKKKREGGGHRAVKVSGSASGTWARPTLTITFGEQEGFVASQLVARGNFGVLRKCGAGI